MIVATAIPASLLVFPILSGLAFALVGVAYQKAQRGGVPAIHTVFHMGIWGALFFTLSSSLEQWTEVPTFIWVTAAVIGLTQWLTAVLIWLTLRLGPLSPMWCVLNLVFVSVTLHAALFLDEEVTVLRGVGIALAIAAVLLASIKGNASDQRTAKRVSLPLYSFLLVLLLIANSGMHISIKHLGTVFHTSGETLMDEFRAPYFTVMYLSMIIPIAITFIVRGDRRAFTPTGWKWGIVAGLGSVGGVGFLALAADLPAAIVFTTSSILSLLGGVIASVTLFSERITLTWWVMVGCAVAAMLLVTL